MDRNLTMDDQILIIFGMNISDTTDHQMAVLFSCLTKRPFLHYLGKTKQAKYYIFIQFDSNNVHLAYFV